MGARRPLSIETRMKISAARKGCKSPNKGKTFSAAYRAKLSAAHLGQTPWNKGKKGVQAAWNKGISATWVIGENNPRWRGGITTRNRILRESIQCREWREKVFERDQFTCMKCGQLGGRLQADHVKPWSIYPELRFDVSNGQTLCVKCHREKTVNDMKDYWRHMLSSDVTCAASYR